MDASVLSSSYNGVPSGSGTQQWPASQQHPFMPQSGPNALFPNGMPGANNMMIPPMAMNMFPRFLQQVATQTKRPIGSIDDDQVLVRAFRERNGRNYRQVLESLDMVCLQTGDLCCFGLDVVFRKTVTAHNSGRHASKPRTVHSSLLTASYVGLLS